MPKFCPECGIKLPIENAKFCPECGFNLTGIPRDQTQEKSTAPSGIVTIPEDITPKAMVQKSPLQETPHRETREENSTSARLNVYDLGVKLEEVVEKIYQADGYETRKRERLLGISNTTNEIDVIAEKGRDKIAIECKNYSRPIGIHEIRNFNQKLEDLNNAYRGVFIAYSELSTPAQEFAQSKNIESLDRDEIKEKWFAISVGRTSVKGEKITLDYAFPLNYDFERVTTLDLKNKELVQIQDAKLTFHPYATFQYKFDARWKDPAKKTHNYEDAGTIVIDLLDGEVLNPLVINEIGAVFKAVKSVLSTEERTENVKRKKILNEIIQTKPGPQYIVSISQDYKIVKLPAEITLPEAKELAIEYITNRNTHNVPYTVEKGENLPELYNATFVPKKRDIAITKNEVILFPKWSIHFRAFDKIYTREALAYSGTLFEDTIRYCPSHFKAGVLSVKKKNIAVCEVCGKACCEDHISQCPECKKWLCQDHSVECSSCKVRFCKDEATQVCQNSQLPLCSACAVECPVCKKIVGRAHLHKCDTCGVTGCEKCVKTFGLIKKKKTCRICFEKVR